MTINFWNSIIMFCFWKERKNSSATDFALRGIKKTILKQHQTYTLTGVSFTFEAGGYYNHTDGLFCPLVIEGL